MDGNDDLRAISQVKVWCIIRIETTIDPVMLQRFLPGTAIRLKFQRTSKIRTYLAKKQQFLFPTILSVRGYFKVISRHFPNLRIRSGYVLFAFNLRSFCVQLHSGVKEI